MTSTSHSAQALLPGPGCWGAFDTKTLLCLGVTCRSDARFFRSRLVAEFAALLQEGEPERFAKALRALTVIVEPSDELVLTVIARYLEASERMMRYNAVASLVGVGRRGGTKIITRVVVDSLKHTDPEVRCSVLKILEHMAKHGDVAASAAIVNSLEDHHDEVRRAGVSAIAELTSRDYVQQIQTITESVAIRLEHDEPHVRDSAAAALICIAVVASAAVVMAVAARLESDEVSTRLVAAQVLELISADGNDLLAGLLPRLAHPNLEVRRAVLQTLLKVIDGNQTEVVAAVFPLLDDADESIRLLAAQASKQFSGKRVARIT